MGWERTRYRVEPLTAPTVTKRVVDTLLGSFGAGSVSPDVVGALRNAPEIGEPFDRAWTYAPGMVSESCSTSFGPSWPLWRSESASTFAVAVALLSTRPTRKESRAA